MNDQEAERLDELRDSVLRTLDDYDDQPEEYGLTL